MEPIRELKLCRDVRIQIDADDHKNDSDHPQEDAFVSVRVCRATHIHGRECKIIAKDVRRVDAFEPTYASEITDEFRDTLQRVAKQSFQDKYRWLVYQTSAILRPWQKNSIQIRVNRETVLAESIEQILGVDISELLLPLRIEFIGEVAVDAGGLEREWFAIVTEQLFDESVGVFRRAQVGALSYVLEESSAEVPDNRVLYLRGAGRLLGRAILEGQLLKAHLAIPLLKHLLGAPLAFSDVEFFDEAVYRSLKWLREHDGVDALGLDFSVTHRLRNGETATVDLKENGRNIDVTDANKDEYIALRVKHLLLDSHAEQLQHLLAGVFEVVPQRLLLVFDHQELDLVLSGAPLIDVADWKENTRVSDDLPDDLLGWFWEIVEALTDDERSRLLQFATGTSRVPVQGFRALTSHDGRIAPFTLKAVPFPENEYIHAHTCFNRLDVPLFPSKQELEQVLTGILAMDATGFTDHTAATTTTTTATTTATATATAIVIIMWSRSVARTVALLATAVAAVQADSDSPGFPSWIAYIMGGGLALLAMYYCCRRNRMDTTMQQPLLGGQYAEDGQPITRQDVQDDDLTSQWQCEVCDFHNKDSIKTCVLCGTERGFSLGLMGPRRTSSSTNNSLKQTASFNRTRSFAIRRLNMLTSRQRGARNRQAWVRKVGPDGRRYWSKRDPEKKLVHQSSLAFVSQLAHTPRHPEGRMTFKEYSEVDARVASHGYEISDQDLEILEQVAALPFKDKYGWFLQQTTALVKPWEDGHLKMRVHRDNILVESMEQLLGVQMEHIHMPLRIEFIGEVAIDAGGLEREWFSLVTERLFDETIGLFMCAHVDSLSYVINPNSEDASTDHLLYFRGAGRLLGRALLEGQLMKAHLALPLLKHLLGVPISFSDLEFLDQEVYKSLKWMKENDGVDALALDFSVTTRKLNGDMELIDLKENGRNIEVTDENKHEYINLRLRYIMLDSFSEQLQHLMAGVFEVIPQELILVFDYQELELVLCGVPSIDVDDWKAHTQVSDELPEELLGWFWEIVEAFTDEERARLLQFTTGTSRVPVQGFKALTSYDGRICHFTLKAVPYPENAYPRAHTCFNRIDLPLYKSKEELEEVLTLVINMEVTGFTDE
ncbi:TPA: hypothetical protein N0F65_005020 [Lagenidium giganteum]|uniref:HECT-type E3 ubiquitin transferase n=1 Tax=Lagenidium giganteum TaxID=4803 RepID=A0AAV2ZHY8_9STRA|nr:TPA: hypothetical protein N0F65_005020 [Lagenidium giganteum]